MADIISKLAERIYQLRVSRKIPCKDVASYIGVDPPMYSRIERGERRLKPEQLSKLAELFNVNIEELYALQLADKMQQAVEGMPIEITKKAISILKEDLK